MKRIEERAYIAVGHRKPPKGAMHVSEMLKFEERTFVNGYIKGATEQRKIEIDKACEVYSKELRGIIEVFNNLGKRLYGVDELGELISLDGCVKDFRKAMEE